MSNYLARLKALENEKDFTNTSNMEVPKVSKGAFGTFGTFGTSYLRDILEKILMILKEGGKKY